MSSSMATTIFESLKQRLNRRSVAFLLCLILAGLFWLLTSLSKEYVDEIEIPISYSDIPENVIITNELTPNVSAEVRGFGFNLLWYWFNYNKAEVKLQANPETLPSINRNGEKVHYVLTNSTMVGMSNVKEEQLEITSISPDTLFIQFKPRYVKKVPVILNANITFEKQFGMTSDPILEPDSVLIIGLKEMIDTIDFVSTSLEEWIDLDESVAVELQLNNYPEQPLIELSQNHVQLELKVEEFTEGTLLLPIMINAKNPTSVKVFPAEVELKYQVPLSEYDKVNQDEFQVSVTLNEISVERNRLSVSIDNQPAAVRQVRIEPQQVEYIIQK